MGEISGFPAPSSPQCHIHFCFRGVLSNRFSGRLGGCSRRRKAKAQRTCAMKLCPLLVGSNPLNICSYFLYRHCTDFFFLQIFHYSHLFSELFPLAIIFMLLIVGLNHRTPNVTNSLHTCFFIILFPSISFK